MTEPKPIQGTLAKYVEFKIFELFRDKLISSIQAYAKEDSKTNVYKHLFLCPSDLSKKRNFQLQGVLSPFVCLWRTAPLDWAENFYSRSVLQRDFEYTDNDGNLATMHGFHYDLHTTFDLFSSSYYKDFRDRVNQDLLDLDRFRYFLIDIKELFPDCPSYTTKAELKLIGITAQDNPDENRSFDLSAQYDLNISLPYSMSFIYIKTMEVYLNENKIYEKELTDD